jgi:hypothetical protein
MNKAYRERGGTVPLILKLSLTPRPLQPLGRSPWNTLKKCCKGPTNSWSQHFAKKNKSFAPGKMQTPIIQLMALSLYWLSCPDFIWSNQECIIYITTFSVSVFVEGVLIFHLTITFCHFLPWAWVVNVTRWMKLKDGGRKLPSPNTRHYPSIFSIGNGQTTKNCSKTCDLDWDLNLKHSEQIAGLFTTQLIYARQKFNPTF